MELTSGILLSLITLLKKIITFFTDWRHDKQNAEAQEAYHEAKEEVEEATSSGDLGDLINAAHKIGEAKKKLS